MAPRSSPPPEADLYWGGLAIALLEGGIRNSIPFDIMSDHISMAHLVSVNYKIGLDKAFLERPDCKEWAPQLVTDFQKEFKRNHPNWPIDVTKIDRAEYIQSLSEAVQQTLSGALREDLRKRDLIQRLGGSEGDRRY